MAKVLFVCTGNTCRSPMAAALARRQARELGLTIEVLSAGLVADDSSSASQGAIAAMEGIEDFSGHCSRPLTGELVEWADLIAVMTTAQRELILKGWPEAKSKTYTLAGMLGEQNPQDVLDPFGQSQEVYNQTRDQIRAMLLKVLPMLKDLPGRIADENCSGQ